MKVSAIIPALNEEKSVGEVVRRALAHVDEVIVVDDGSTDNTAAVAEAAGATVIRHEKNRGILEATASGIGAAEGDILVTLDSDGQHDPSEIPQLIAPILEDRADLVLGRRPSLPHFSEKAITALTGLKVDVGDASTGFRAVKRSIAEKMKLHGSCLCGTLILEAYRLGARIAEIPITIRERRDGRRRLNTRHLKQFFYVLYHLARP